MPGGLSKGKVRDWFSCREKEELYALVCNAHAALVPKRRLPRRILRRPEKEDEASLRKSAQRENN
jgi:hypothetical protein